MFSPEQDSSDTAAIEFNNNNNNYQNQEWAANTKPYSLCFWIIESIVPLWSKAKHVNILYNNLREGR